MTAKDLSLHLCACRKAIMWGIAESHFIAKGSLLVYRAKHIIGRLLIALLPKRFRVSMVQDARELQRVSSLKDELGSQLSVLK